ncbi:unnamed protein product, partial [Ceratitis capitata]
SEYGGKDYENYDNKAAIGQIWEQRLDCLYEAVIKPILFYRVSVWWQAILHTEADGRHRHYRSPAFSKSARNSPNSAADLSEW